MYCVYCIATCKRASSYIAYEIRASARVLGRPNLRVGEALTPWLTLAAFVHVACDWLKTSTQRVGLRNVHLVGQRMMVRSCDNQHRGVKVMFIYKGLLVYN
jgi:hypothetical protein